MSSLRKTPRIVYWIDNNLYINITNRCSNNCYFCFRKFKNGIKEFNLKLEKEPTLEEVKKELQANLNKKNWNEVVFCGFGEPLERLDIVLEISKWLKKKDTEVVRVDTNGQGYLLNNNRDVVKELKEAGINKVRVSLNTHNKVTYNEVCNPNFENAYEKILEFIQKSLKENIETEVTAVTIPEVELIKVREIAERMGAKFSTRQYIQFFW